MKATAPVNPSYNFTVESDGDHHTIRYKQAPWHTRIALRLCWYTIVPSIVLVSSAGPDDFGAAVILLFVLTLGSSCLIVFIRNMLHSKPQIITVNTREIGTDTGTYAIEHISKFYVHDPNNRNETTITVMSRSLRHNVDRMGIENRNAIQKRMRNAACKIMIRYGTGDVALAKGLGAVEADVLLRKIVSLSGFGQTQPHASTNPNATLQNHAS